MWQNDESITLGRMNLHSSGSIGRPQLWKVHSMQKDFEINVIGLPLAACSKNPLTGFFSFPGLNPGDSWCLCAGRFLQAHQEGCAPQVQLASTHQKAMEVVPIEVLRLYAAQ
jgi:uncharacterized protein (DUF2237 family)